MAIITIVSSSTRIGRISHRISLMLAEQIKQKGYQTQIVDLLEYDLGTFQQTFASMENPPEKLKEIQDMLMKSDAFVFVTPEYNGSISSGLKHFIDLFAKKPFEHKPIGVATGSTGAMGGTRAAHHLQLSILACFAYPIPEMLMVPTMDKTLSEDGEILDEKLVWKDSLSKQVSIKK